MNMRVVEDCNDYIPFAQGALRGSVNYPEGIYGGEIAYNTPYAHYQYTGEFWDSSLWSWPAAVDYLVMKYIVAPLYDYYQKNPNPVVAIPPVFLP